MLGDNLSWSLGEGGKVDRRQLKRNGRVVHERDCTELTHVLETSLSL